LIAFWKSSDFLVFETFVGVVAVSNILRNCCKLFNISILRIFLFSTVAIGSAASSAIAVTAEGGR